MNNVWMLAITFVPMIMAGALMNTVANRTLTKKVPETATGEFFSSLSEHVSLFLINLFALNGPQVPLLVSVWQLTL